VITACNSDPRLRPVWKPSMIADEREVPVNADTTMNHQKYFKALSSARAELVALLPKLAIILNIGGQMAKNAVHTSAGIRPVNMYFRKLFSSQTEDFS
jgi:hypothetical protein